MVDFSSNFISHFTHKYALSPDSKMAPKSILTGSSIPWLMTSKPSKPPAKRITGMESKKENLALEVLEKPRNKAALMVMPDLEVPGIKAKAWAKPIIRATFKVIFKIFLFPALLSARYKMAPKNMVENAITKGLRKCSSMKFFPKKPNIKTGMVPIKTPQTTLLSPTFWRFLTDETKSLSKGSRSSLKYHKIAIKVPTCKATSKAKP